MKFVKGDTVAISFTNNAIKYIKINELHPNGITGKNINLINSPLTFYPFTNILSISKYN